jgi:hypothetical protein
MVHMAQGHTTQGADNMSNATMQSTTLAEAMRHAEDNYRRTNGMVCGGGYWVESPEGDVYHAEIRVNETGAYEL